MGAFLDRLRGRPRLQPDKIKAVWNGFISNNKDYFLRLIADPQPHSSKVLIFESKHLVILNVTARDEGMRDILLTSKHYTTNEDERNFVLSLLADRIFAFFEVLMSDDVLRNMSEFKKICYTMGQQHSAYSQDTFKLVYWDGMTLAMLEELEEGGAIGREELRAWQTLLHVINENMLVGYHDARSSMRNF